jgi:hypothetical protein
MNIVPFNQTTLVPADLASAMTMFADINKDVITAPSFPVLSIKGKVFTMNRDGIKKIITKPNPDGDEDEVAQAVGVVVLRANMKAKTFYLKKFNNTDSEGARPDCYSYDGEKPSPNATNPQANKCALCAHNQWGSRTGDGDKEESKGKACAANARLAVATPDKLDDPMLLRVPPASLKNLRDMVKELNARKVMYNIVATRIGFDAAEASPKLTFKAVGLLPATVYPQLKEMYDNEIVRAIVGADDIGADSVVPHAEADGDTHVEAAAKVIEKAKAPVAAPAAAPAVAAAMESLYDEPAAAEPAPAPAPAKAAAKAKPAAKKEESAAAQILTDMSALLGGFDD